MTRQVEKKLIPWRQVPKKPPMGGWIKTIRQALGMNAAQLARRMNLTRQGLAELEIREKESSVTLAALSKAADAMDCDLVYAIVPRSELGAILESKARSRAEADVKKVTHTMRLEDQEVPAEEEERLIQERTADLLSRNSRKIWEMDPGENIKSVTKRSLRGGNRGSDDD